MTILFYTTLYCSVLHYTIPHYTVFHTLLTQVGIPAGVTSNITSTAADAAAAVNSATSGVVSSVQEATSGITAGATQALEGLQSSFASEIQLAQKQAAGVQAGLESLQARASGAVDAAVASLPEPLRQAFDAAGPPLNALIARVRLQGLR